MSSVFPTGLPFATAFYLTLYLATWALHWAFMHYVAAGSLWVFGAAVEDAVLGGEVWRRPMKRTLLSWLPFMLSGAVTAGVAPLLFMQILYAVPFYTANLLLSWIWMLIVPALIALFYLFYLLQAFSDREGFAWVRVGLAAAAVGCIVLTGGLWSTNHLLANAPVERWTAAYAGEASLFDWPPILARAMVWLGLSFPGMAMIAGWQLLAGDYEEDEHSSGRMLALTALGGLVLFAIGCFTVYSQLAPVAQQTIMSPFAIPYVLALAVGIVLLAAAWLWTAIVRRLAWPTLAAATAGYLTTLLSLAVVREAIRLGTLGYESFQAIHARAAEVEGFWVFVFFAGLNGGLIACCVWLIARYAGQSPAPEDAHPAGAEGGAAGSVRSSPIVAQAEPQ